LAFDPLIEDSIAVVSHVKLFEKRWEIDRAAQGKGELSVRELARGLVSGTDKPQTEAQAKV
jgi:hypothetical protein